MNKIFPIATVILTIGLSACNDAHVHEKIQQDARATEQDVKKAANELGADAKTLGQKVDAAVKPDSRSASQKISEAADKVRGAASVAEDNAAHAALLAGVTQKLSTDVGLFTLREVTVSADVNGVVTLTGTVRNEDQKKEAEQSALKVDGVTKVNNELTIAP